jgi:glyoxylase-like metal-dependent hydrolase (beta-lactamase superfamily II)
MTEPKETAQSLQEVVPGVFHWHVHDDRIDFISAAHALRTGEGTVLIDPLPLAGSPLGSLRPAIAICLTSGGHQRSSWRLRRELGAPVYAPALSRTLEEEPDVRYRDGDTLPGGLLAVFTPGAGTTQHTLLLEQPSVAFVSDLLVRPPGGELALIDKQYAHDIEQARRSVERLLELPFSVLCLAHGEPVTERAKDAIRSALAAATD